MCFGQGLCSSTPRGDGNYVLLGSPRIALAWFMQLNPARGRKLGTSASAMSRRYAAVYAAQPREGTETGKDLSPAKRPTLSQGLCSSTPRGDGNREDRLLFAVDEAQVYAAQPREGTETCTLISTPPFALSIWFMQLNPARGRKLAQTVCMNMVTKVYAAQPREGTETKSNGMRVPQQHMYGFMQLNLARGRKHGLIHVTHRVYDTLVYAAQPREGTETSEHELEPR